MMIRLIQMRAPIRWRIMLLGISKIRYPMKKIPDRNPNTSAERPRELFISSAAYPKLTRSRKATT